MSDYQVHTPTAVVMHNIAIAQHMLGVMGLSLKV